MIKNSKLKELFNQQLTIEQFEQKLNKFTKCHVVRPGEIQTREIRMNQTRFFPQVKDGYVFSGYFS